MKITYYANDGYVTGDRPLHVSIPDTEIAEYETIEEAIEFIGECIDDDFKNKVIPSYDRSKIEEKVQALIESKTV